MQVINTALCSFGMSGWVFHAPFLSNHPGFKFYAVWERSKNLAQEKYPDVTVFRTYEEMLADKTVDLVIVNTPSYTHFDYARQALQAGKHVIVEKPFTATVVQAEELQALANKQGKLLSVFQNRRHDSDFKTVKKVIGDDLLGEITEGEIHYDRFNPVLSPKAHKETPGPAVGVVYDLGSHLIDQALHLFGMPTAVWADVFSMRPNSQVDDYLEIVLFYPTKRVRIKSTYYAREPLGYIVHGKKGSFIKSRADIQEPALQASRVPGSADWGAEPETERGLLHTEKDGKVIKEYIPTLAGNYMEYYDGIYQALTTSSVPPVSAQDGINTIRIIEASYKSSKERKVIEL
jgi:scyllo-inositol 2-dehydrogenase (NADP+)